MIQYTGGVYTRLYKNVCYGGTYPLTEAQDNIHWGLGLVQMAIGHILFSAQIIVDLHVTFFNLSTDRIVFFVYFLSR